MGFQCLLGALLFILVDAAVFRSGWYFQWVDPVSSAGIVAQAIDNIRHVPAGQKVILAMGDSRVGEGFSPRMANVEAARSGLPYAFVSRSVAGTTPRVWFYLLRQIRNPAERLAAVTVMVTSYHDNDPEVQAERRSDIAFLHPLLRLEDAADFPWSFPSGAGRLEATEAILFSGLFYKTDIQDFLRNPGKRLRAVTAWHQHGYEWVYAYPGRAPSLEGLDLDLVTGTLSIPPGHAAIQVGDLAPYAGQLRRFRGRPPDNAAATAYRREWLGRIAALCRADGVKLFVYRIPRGPLHHLVGADNTPTGVLAQLAHEGALELLPASLFDRLERPEFYFDELHLNTAGRALFTRLLTTTVLQRLSAER